MKSENRLRWIFRLEENFTWNSGLKFDHVLAYKDKEGVVRLIVEPDGCFTVLKDYAWDGCTPKFNFFDIVFGTPDGVPDPDTFKPKTYYASLLHDAMYQFVVEGLPVTRPQADRIFLQMLTKAGFRPRRIYYFFVWAIGWAVWRANRRIRQTAGQRQLLDLST